MEPHFRAAALVAVAMARATACMAETPATANVCGPRCVQYVLKEYGQDCDLIALIQEMQWPHLDRGCTLADIQAALEKRGIETKGISLPEGATLRWSRPAIVHLKTGDSDRGHFVVHIPQAGMGRISVWNGLSGVYEMSRKDFLAQRSGAVLLTSTEPISDATGAVAQASYVPLALVIAVALSLLGINAFHKRVKLGLFTRKEVTGVSS